ncbi:tail protein [Lactobacillus phage Nyseid]|uniref:Uncharacterized protein n=1 Tax=Lactobacillus phage Nyseid TaxID=2079432 RepID=A0A2K9VCB5_9CAUD|nr:tail protein [Lactobacillus phage Nyseid]AUV59857.1 hypothetical protein [Lactobacillus phage Nyseid]
MAKTLEYADTSAQTVKIGDTTTSFTMVLGEDSNPVDLTNATSIIAKIGNSTGYLKEQTVTSDNIPDPLSGQVVIKFDSDFMSGLPAGSYLLEVWVTYDSGVAIYPSGALTGFTINNNIESQSGSVITSISYDDFVKAMNKAASTIAKGDKGDTGPIGPQGVMTNDQVNTLIDNKIKYTSIPNGTDLFTHVNNTGNTEHLCVNSNAAAGSLLNCPVTTVFTLDIKTASPANRPAGSAGNPTWVYNQLELHPYQSRDIYTTSIETDGNGAFITHPWKKLVTQTSGTLDVEPAFYGAGTTSSTGALKYVLTGNILHVSGFVSPSADLEAGATPVLFNLPSSIGTITERIGVIQQGSNFNLYTLFWQPSGAVSVIKHNTAGTATAITTSMQLQVSADIVINPK